MSRQLVDYFTINGLHIPSGLEPDQLSGDSYHSPPLQRPYKVKVLAHYPDHVAGSPFDKDAVAMLCHPKGLKFCTERDPRPISFHSFLITKEDGCRSYGAALTFYEKVVDPQIWGAMQTLQAMYLADQPVTSSPSHAAAAAPHSPKLLGRPRRKISSQQLFDAQKDALFVTRSICVVSVLPLISTMERFLRALLSLSWGEIQEELALECYVYNMIFEVPLPPAGASLKLSVPGQSVICQRPGDAELPLLDHSLKQVLGLLGVSNAMSVFTSMLLEHQILLYSTDYQRLMMAAEGLTALMFPFSWPHVYVPILPASLMHFLDAPVPFIMGLHHAADEDTLSSLSSKANMCFVNLDLNSVELPDDLPEFPFHSQLVNDVTRWLKSSPPLVNTSPTSLPFNSLRTSLTSVQSDKGNHQRDSGFGDSFGVVEDPSKESSQSNKTSNVGEPPQPSENAGDWEKGGSNWSLPSSHKEVLSQSEVLAKVTALARRTGVISSAGDIEESLKSSIEGSRAQSRQRIDAHARELLCNSALRELFLHYFLHIFKDYESFVIQPPSNITMDHWVSNRESMQNFDKTAFLGDQPEGHLPFLSAFIETQMFASFVDNKILALWEETESNLKLFDVRLQNFKDEFGDRRVKQYNRNSMAIENETLIQRRASTMSMFAPIPHPLEGDFAGCTKESFPILSTQVLNRKPQSNKSNGQADTNVHLRMHFDQREKHENRAKVNHNPKLSDLNLSHMSQTNWKFVEQLLKEVKAKTKRILVEKMGQEAFELGHRESIHLGVEENTLIASLCDLLERIWNHGQINKQGKSALWWHLLRYQEEEHFKSRGGPANPDPALNYPDLRDVTEHPPSGSGSEDDCPSGMQTWPVRRHKRKSSKDREVPQLSPMKISLITDMRNIQQITDLKTDVGCARAWVRLALEKKLLSKHLKELFRNADLMKRLYKRYAFVRCEDEREQFLYHLLSLNAVDFHCFTNTFTNISIPYRVLIFPRVKTGSSSTTANCWFSLAGQLRETTKVPIPKNTLEIPLQHKNLGVLTTMRIGHDNVGISPKWLVEHVVVRNEVNGHMYRFPCGRWLGKGVDDGALERLLIAEVVPPSMDTGELSEKCRTPPRCRSPTVSRRSSEAKLQIFEVQTMLSDAINNLVKHFYRPEKERNNVTPLLCGEYGVVYSMEQVFEFGFKSSRVFRSRIFIWDFLEKVHDNLESLIHDEQIQLLGEIRQVILTFCFTVARINQASETVGKDERFQIFICVALRDHLLQKWIRIISRNPLCTSMYEEKSFLRDSNLLQHIIQLLDSLNDFEINLEKSIVKGVSL